MLDALKRTHPAVVEEVVPGKLSLGTVHRVLQRLLRERVPIRDLVTILEALGDAADSTKDPVMLTEHVRRALSDAIARGHLDEQGLLPAITLGPRLEQSLSALLSPRQGQPPTELRASPRGHCDWARGSTTSRSTCRPVRSSESSRSRARVRTSCSMCWRVPGVPTGAP